MDIVWHVNCPQCGNEQPDRGQNQKCKECGFSPMPYFNDQGFIQDDPLAGGQRGDGRMEDR